MEPLVSVIVPNYNAEKFIRQFLDCMIKQTYNNWELIIVDDGSTDRSPDIVSEYASKDARIRLLYRPDDRNGACRRRNQGYDAAKGELICFFDSDDLLPENSLEVRVKAIQDDPQLDFVVTPAISFIKEPYDIRKLALGIPLFDDDLGMFLKRYRLPFGVWTNIYRKESLDQFGIRWDEDLASLQDSDFNIRMLAAGARYKYVDEYGPGYYWRIGGNPNSITKNIKSSRNLDSQLYFYKKLLYKFGSTKYKRNVERFGLTLLLRFALCQSDKIPEILFSRHSHRTKYKMLRSLYGIGVLRKIYPVINLIMFPVAVSNEYLFLIKNRRICKKYIDKYARK